MPPKVISKHIKYDNKDIQKKKLKKNIFKRKNVENNLGVRSISRVHGSPATEEFMVILQLENFNFCWLFFYVNTNF